MSEAERALNAELVECVRRAVDCMKDRPGPYGGTLARCRAALAKAEGSEGWMRRPSERSWNAFIEAVEAAHAEQKQPLAYFSLYPGRWKRQSHPAYEQWRDALRRFHVNGARNANKTV